MRRKSITTEMMKSYIADALLILMTKKDYTDITVGEIVEKAGVNRSTYYRHFEKKEDVITYFLDQISKDILEWDKAAAYSARTAHPFQRNGAPFRFKLSKAQHIY